MQTVLVTGATGFIGKNLCAQLKQDKNVTILRFDKKNTLAELETYIAQADFVFHLAGVNRLDERLESVLLRKPEPQWVAEEHVRVATDTILPLDGDVLPSIVIHLCGDDMAAHENVAALIAHRAAR